MSCGSGADAFIEKHFKDCVYNVRDYIGFCLGLAAIAFWVIAQLPQYYRNYKTKSAEALSPWFLAQWLLGDTFNLIGALLQGQQLPTTVYTAMYFVIADMFMMMQFIYYGALQRRREKVLRLQARRRHHHHRRHRTHRDSSSRERDALLSPQQHHAPAAAGDHVGVQPEQQQAGGQLPTRASSQQQERRRSPHAAGLHVNSGQQSQQACDRLRSCTPAVRPASGLHATSKAHSQLQHQHQQQQHAAHGHGDFADTASDEDCSSCSDRSCPSSPSGSSRRGLEAGGSPAGKGVASGAYSVAPVTCSAAAGGGLTGVSSAHDAAGIKMLPAGLRHWGGLRSVIAVAVLVSLGLVSLLPASATRGMFPISTPGLSAAVLHAADASTPARAIQAGSSAQEQLAGSIHLSAPPLLPTQQAAAQGGGADSIAASSSSSSTDGSSKGPGSEAGGSNSSSSSSGTSRASWARRKRVGVGDQEPEHDWSFIVGTGLGYVASVLYLCSRMSQIHKNYTRKSSEGLALVMFIMAVCANLCTGTSIILRTFTWVELKEQLPWIIGSLGTISLDMVILWQSNVYSKEGQQQQLLPAVGDGAHVVHSSGRHLHHRHHHQPALDGQPGQQQHHHHAVDVGQEAGGGAMTASAAAALDGMPVGAHQHRSGISSGALLGRRHAAAGATSNDVLAAAEGAEVVVPLMMGSRAQR